MHTPSSVSLLRPESDQRKAELQLDAEAKSQVGKPSDRPTATYSLPPPPPPPLESWRLLLHLNQTQLCADAIFQLGADFHGRVGRVCGGGGKQRLYSHSANEIRMPHLCATSSLHGLWRLDADLRPQVGVQRWRRDSRPKSLLGSPRSSPSRSLRSSCYLQAVLFPRQQKVLPLDARKASQSLVLDLGAAQSTPSFNVLPVVQQPSGQLLAAKPPPRERRAT